MCSGTEENLLMCAHAHILTSNCDHSQDAAVKCGGKFCITNVLGYESVSVLFFWLQLLVSMAQ